MRGDLRDRAHELCVGRLLALLSGALHVCNFLFLPSYDDDESAGVPGCARAADPASEEVDLEKRKRVAIGNKLYTQEIER